MGLYIDRAVLLLFLPSFLYREIKHVFARLIVILWGFTKMLPSSFDFLGLPFFLFLFLQLFLFLPETEIKMYIDILHDSCTEKY